MTMTTNMTRIRSFPPGNASQIGAGVYPGDAEPLDYASDECWTRRRLRNCPRARSRMSRGELGAGDPRCRRLALLALRERRASEVSRPADTRTTRVSGPALQDVSIAWRQHFPSRPIARDRLLQAGPRRA